MRDVNEDDKYSKAWCNKYPHGAWERINELEKELQLSTTSKRLSENYHAKLVNEKNLKLEKLEKQLAESVPKSDFIAVYDRWNFGTMKCGDYCDSVAQLVMDDLEKLLTNKE